MDIAPFTVEREKAKELWKEYVDACKKNPKDEFLKDMKAIYNQMKSGRKVVDIHEVFRRGGLTIEGYPRLAIARADIKKVYCYYRRNGRVTFYNTLPYWSNKVSSSDVDIPGVYPALNENQIKDKWREYLRLEAPLPAIPASIKPSRNLQAYHILWEVDKWEPIPPRDPYLLRRLSPNMFVVVAGWELTELERAVMKGRVS